MARSSKTLLTSATGVYVVTTQPSKEAFNYVGDDARYLYKYADVKRSQLQQSVSVDVKPRGCKPSCPDVLCLAFCGENLGLDAQHGVRGKESCGLDSGGI